MNRVTDIFLGADMRCSHFGLNVIAAKKKVYVEDLKPGEHILFVNTKKTMAKMYSANKVVSFIKVREKERIDIQVLSRIPASFQAGGKLAYTKALKEKLLKKR